MLLSIVFAQVLRYKYVHNLFRKVQTILLIDLYNSLTPNSTAQSAINIFKNPYSTAKLILVTKCHTVLYGNPNSTAKLFQVVI